MDDAWEKDEFVLDPTKITLHIGKTGVDGDTFKNKYLMDKFNIQINKTSRNTVLFMTNIGTTRGSITYLTNALLQIADELDEEFKSLNAKELEIREQKIHSLTKDVPPLPDFSYFHHSFQAANRGMVQKSRILGNTGIAMPSPLSGRRCEDNGPTGRRYQAVADTRRKRVKPSISNQCGWG